MKKVIIIVICAAVAVGLFVFLPRVEKAGGSGEALTEGAKAPDFTAELNDGTTFNLSKNKDKVVLVNFWATWCPPCCDELPVFEKLKNEKIDGVEIIAVNCSEDKATVDSFIKDNGYTFGVAYDENGSVGSLYPTNGIPYTLIIKNGIIEKTFLGEPHDPYTTYKEAITACLK
ncbi:MAG: TlpA family protein disulfide reductase [Clostridia bacterium]|nr:TlpA family protein disulfide reductase [Clostridia bacterium]